MNDLYGIMQEILLREEQITTLQELPQQEQDYFWIIGFDDNNTILFIESANWTKIDDHSVEPMEVFGLALQKQASQIILCRNYPGGVLSPSEKDNDIIDRLIQVGRIVNTPVVDHYIISTQNYVSFQQLGLMQELQQSIKYVPSFELAKRIQAEAAELIEKRDAEAKAKIELIQQELEAAQEKAKKDKFNIAKALKGEGIDWAIIASIMGLSLEELEGL
ncbi:MAG: JAB domain-containing protein [Aureispira sp.]